MSKMYNNLVGNGATVTEKLGLDSEVRELKFGNSFNAGNQGQHGSFHTIKYDFKPASVDKSKPASLEMGQSGQVTISMPHYDNNGSTVFKGSTRPYTKECVLIIDRDTGEFVLEKLSHNVQVKKTRQEGGSGKSSMKNQPSNPAVVESGKLNSGRTEVMNSSFKDNSREREFKEENAGSSSSKKSSHLNLPGAPAGRRPQSPMISGGSSLKHSPKPPPNGNLPPAFENNKHTYSSFDAAIIKQSSAPMAAAMPSLNSFEDLIAQPAQPQKLPSPNVQRKHKSEPAPTAVVRNSSKVASEKKGDLSESSSGDDSSGSSSSEDDDDSSSASDMEEVEVPSVESMINKIAPLSSTQPRHSPALPPPVANSISSMPNLDVNMPSHLLCEDLQLSDSEGSDLE